MESVLISAIGETLPRVFESRIFQGAFRHQQQAVGFERFLDKVVGAAFDGGDSRLVIAVTGDHHDRQFGMQLLGAIEQLKTIQPAALQPNVEENQIGPARNDSGQRFVAVARRARSVPLVLQDARDQFANVGFVVNDQDVGCHGIVRPLKQLAHLGVARTSPPTTDNIKG
jgi:hypothetical protein